jgi:DnaJ-class molecular chaperone
MNDTTDAVKDNLFKLGLVPGATIEEIKSATKFMKAKWHPDKTATDATMEERTFRAAKFEEIDIASSFLISMDKGANKDEEKEKEEEEEEEKEKEKLAVRPVKKAKTIITNDGDGYVTHNIPVSIDSIMNKFNNRELNKRDKR